MTQNINIHVKNQVKESISRQEEKTELNCKYHSHMCRTHM